MMTVVKGIGVNFYAENADVVRKGEQVADTLEKVGESGEDAGKQASDGLEKVADGADDASDAAGDLGDGLGDLGEVGKQVLEGDLGGAAESAAGMLTALGPAAALGGAVAAGAIALVTEELAANEAQAARLGEALARMWQDAIANNRTYLDSAQITREAQDIILNPERVSEYNQAQMDARDLGIDVNNVILARAGDEAALEVVLAAVNDRQEAYNQKLEDAANAGERNNIEKTRESEMIAEITARYEALGEQYDTAGANAQHAAELGAEAAQQERDQIALTNATSEERWDALAQSYATAAARPPIDIHTNLQQPDLEGMFRNLQSLADTKVIVFRAKATLDGKDIL